jgi:hypothetical protein
MKRPVRLVQGDNERLAALERRVDTVDETLTPMQTQLSEIHDLLFGAKAIAWFMTKALLWTGGIVTIIGGLVGIWKAVH